MENENIKREEELTEEIVPESIEEVTEPEVEEEISEPVAEEEMAEATEVEESESEETEETEAVEESEEGEDVIGDEWKTDDATATETVAEDMDVELSDEELENIIKLKKQKKKKSIIVIVAIAVVLALAAFFICYTEGVGGSTVVGNPINMGQDGKIKDDNIKYENPISEAFKAVIGKDKNVALTINGAKVDKGVLGFATNSSGINCIYSLMQAGLVSDIEKFDWNGIEEQTGLSYKELSKGMAIDVLIPIYATIAEGEKRGVVLDEADEKKITDWIDEQKKNYGDEFENVLKQSGYENEEALYELQRIQLYMQKVYEDIEANPENYITPQMKASLGDDKVTVKHILVQFEADEEGNVTDEKKAEAKKEAEEVLAKVKAGEDFEKLIEEYNDDPGATDEGYTFANDGTMVQEFAEASFVLEIGATSELVETTYGYHIIKRLERAVNADDYISILTETVPVKVKKGVYDKMSITIDLKALFGTPETNESEAE